MKATISAALLIAAGVGAVAGRTGVDIAAGPPAALPPDFRGMVVSELGYDPETRKIFQNVHSATKHSITAIWSAKITRDGEVICVGGGTAPYNAKSNAERTFYAPVDWAGQTPRQLCPDALQSGDVLLANWEHRDGKGLTRSVAKRIVLP